MARKKHKPRYDGELSGIAQWIEIALAVLAVVPIVFDLLTETPKDDQDE